MEHQAAMELGYSLDMGLAKNLLAVEQPCHSVIPSQQYYYEYSTAPAQNFLSVPPLSIQGTNGQPFYGFGAAASQQQHFELSAVSSQAHSQLGFPSLAEAAATSFPTYGGYALVESSVFLSPQTSAPTSAAQSPQSATPEPAGELWDDLTNLDDILNGDGILSEEVLFDVLADVGCTDFLNQLETAGSPQVGDLESCFTPSQSSSSSSCSSSVASSPKRKYSTDSSGCYSLDSFEACSSESGLAKPAKRARRIKPTKEEKAARKKDQNKKAASRYRDKKKSEVQSSEHTLEELESHRDRLTSELKKLQTEFGVILPLAKAAFAFDPVRNQHLTQLIARVDALI